LKYKRLTVANDSEPLFIRITDMLEEKILGQRTKAKKNIIVIYLFG